MPRPQDLAIAAKIGHAACENAMLLPHCCLALPRFCLGRMENVGQRRALMRGRLRSSEGLDRLFSLVGAEGLDPPTFAL